jgi:type II secretory pathway predicted ATPase ExeA
MHQQYYGLTGDPFRLSPDHAFCYRHPSFAKGRAYMQYALQAAEGFVVITGSPGMGKTTLINDLLADYGPSDYLVATLVNTMLEATDILRSIAYEFGLDVQGLDAATVLQKLKELFIRSHQSGQPPLLVVDEAQNLSLGALEELRLLTNLQVRGRPLLQIFLVGQEGLREKLQDPAIEQLRQRVTAAAHLQPLSQEQTAAYIVHRLKVVGWNHFPRIRSSVLPIIGAACQGVPRRINQFCSRLLLHGAVEEKAVLDAEDAKTVFRELSEERLSHTPAGSSSALASAYLGDSDTEVEEGGDQEEVLTHDEELPLGSKKVVMPPRRSAIVDDQMLTAGPVSPDRPAPLQRRDRAHDEMPSDNRPRQMDSGGGRFYPLPRGRGSFPEPRPPSGVAGLGYAFLFLLLLVGLGAYAWYEYDRNSVVALFDEVFDPIQLSPHMDGPARAAGSSQPEADALTRGGPGSGSIRE